MKDYELVRIDFDTLPRHGGYLRAARHTLTIDGRRELFMVLLRYLPPVGWQFVYGRILSEEDTWATWVSYPPDWYWEWKKLRVPWEFYFVRQTLPALTEEMYF